MANIDRNEFSRNGRQDRKAAWHGLRLQSLLAYLGFFGVRVPNVLQPEATVTHTEITGIGPEPRGKYSPNLKEFMVTWSITPTFRPPISARNLNSGSLLHRQQRPHPQGPKKVDSLDNNAKVGMRVTTQSPLFSWCRMSANQDETLRDHAHQLSGTITIKQDLHSVNTIETKSHSLESASLRLQICAGIGVTEGYYDEMI